MYVAIRTGQENKDITTLLKLSKPLIVGLVHKIDHVQLSTLEVYRAVDKLETLSAQPDVAWSIANCSINVQRLQTVHKVLGWCCG